jgi:cyclopropane-fatty-acyl-phospholipid synthase
MPPTPPPIAKNSGSRHPFFWLFSGWLLKLGAGVRAGEVEVHLPNGDVHIFKGENQGPSADFLLHNWRGARRMALGGDVGFAEGYLDGDWSTSDLSALLELAVVNNDTLESKVEGTTLMRLLDRTQHLLRANTRRGSRRNIQEHYDLGNDFYREWLDPSMTYSAGIYERPNDPLEEAQLRKYQRIGTCLQPKPGDRILEIGCGWGGLATYLARTYGCHVRGVTLSHEQHAYATERAEREGLSDQIDIVLEDYRDIRGGFDGIASIEMFEAVGENNWPTYFQTVSRLLNKDARAALQVITIDDNRFESYRRGADFIQRYVFPGGMLPSPSQFRQHAEREGLRVDDSYFFGQSYANTIGEWHARFVEAWPSIEKTGFDDRFKRLWEYYLAYCKAGFKTGAIDVGQFVLARR